MANLSHQDPVGADMSSSRALNFVNIAELNDQMP